jgi:uncharacterized membrane protein YfcA
VRKDEGMIKPLLAFVGGFMAVYFMMSFTMWEPDPTNWTQDGRSFLVTIGTWVGLMGSFITVGWKKYYE